MEIRATLDFDLKKDENLFDANEVTDESKKQAILLSQVNAETYNVIATVCKPKKPFHRHEFCQRMQLDQESISEYVAALRSIATDCQFEEKEDEQLLDQLIVGLKSEAIEEDLLKLEKPALDQSLKKTMSFEAANEGAEK
ncbi:hypothetical protein QAD02_021887 [Eretmocerus hayati]|uniref:Uncharacterized protein n=1 Tax=Eretmocerus hayati TaxID=131215 RepID=A0ACC2PRH8_9HYME|nr:hypothetical protein QAD02_021887 [Eretmocerus hayati]